MDHVTHRWVVLLLGLVVVVGTAPGISSAAKLQPEIKTITPPTKDCDVVRMTGDGSRLYFLDQCDVIRSWDPQSAATEIVTLSRVPGGMTNLAVSENRIAVLVGEKQEIWVFDKGGAFLKKYAYDGETVVREIAVLGDYVAVTTWFDDHLLFLYDEPNVPPLRLIENPEYWPDAAPRYRSEADVAVDGDHLVVVDRVNYVVYEVDPKSGAVVRFPKDPYPNAPAITKPTGKWSNDNDHKRYTSVLYSTSSTAHAGEAYLVMLDRRVTDDAGYEEHYLEIASSARDAVKWTRRAELNDRYRFAGSMFPTLIGDTMYLYMPKNGVVHAVPIDR